MSEEIKPKPVRTAVYIDGFNLYFGLREQGWRKYYWLDLWNFSDSLANGRQLVTVKYFTADVGGGGGKVQRQQTFLKANSIQSPQLKIIKGKYLQKSQRCRHCSNENIRNEEKMTDVNIATHLLIDAWKDAFDVAIVVSGDSDLVPPITAVKTEFTGKQVLVAFPPKRVSSHMGQTTGCFHIRESAFKKCQLPVIVECEDGSGLSRPPSWI